MGAKIIKVDDFTYNKLREIQNRYREKYERFISLGDLIKMILTIPSYIKNLMQ